MVLQQFPPPYNLRSLQHAAQTLGLNNGWRDISATEFPKLAAFASGLHKRETPAGQQ